MKSIIILLLFSLQFCINSPDLKISKTASIKTDKEIGLVISYQHLCGMDILILPLICQLFF